MRAAAFAALCALCVSAVNNCPVSNQSTDISAEIIGRCRSLGFALAGIAPAEPTRWGKELRDWLAAGKHGEMAYLERHLEALLDPRKVLPGARSIICVADRYHDGSTDEPEERGLRGRIARYARGEDYHKTIKKRLHALCDWLEAEFPQEKFRGCVDTAPLLEREYAARAGLGAIGKHTLLIGKPTGMGSYLLLGEVLTTLALPATEETTASGGGDPCGSCTRCIDACPTQAIAPWSIDARKCISYQTIEHRSAIGEEWHARIGEWIFGCDICQEVCPHNQPTKRALAGPTNPAYEARHASFDLLEVLNWTEDDRRREFTRSAMKRARLNMMKRNALIAAGNLLGGSAGGGGGGGEAALLARMRAIAADAAEDEMVRATAKTMLIRLGA